MRGAHYEALIPRSAARIIPADAGSTGNPKTSGSAITDHPRGCGEHLAVVVARHGHGGSSPRMRGALNTTTTDPDMMRIIPADAGSTIPTT